ncbi:hypothetical protein [Promineifilum sp.]|uniref:hypothetical protein n=1 Tax=Promineifilum sp. TaxID=2664178 RepID=UPI0035B1C890
MSNLSVAELTVDEFRALIREVVTETLADLLTDPDEGLELSDEFEAELHQAMERWRAGQQQTHALEDIIHDLSLE